MQRAYGGDQHSRPDCCAISGSYAPVRGRFIPYRFFHAGVHANILIHAKALRAGFQVALNFVAPGVHAAPIGIAVERK